MFETFLFEIVLLYLLYTAFKFRTCDTCTEDLILRLKDLGRSIKIWAVKFM